MLDHCSDPVCGVWRDVTIRIRVLSLGNQTLGEARDHSVSKSLATGNTVVRLDETFNEL